MNIFLQLIIEFFKTGLFAVGGGLATIPFLEEMIVNYGWFTANTLSTMIAVSESTPGPIGINMATYVGFVTAGLPGAVIATLALVTPGITIICLISKVLTKFQESKLVKGIFYGIKPAVVGFILAACVSIFLLTLFNVDAFQISKDIFSLFNYFNIALFVIIYLIYSKVKLNPIVVIVICAFLGIIFKL